VGAIAWSNKPTQRNQTFFPPFEIVEMRKTPNSLSPSSLTGRRFMASESWWLDGDPSSFMEIREAQSLAASSIQNDKESLPDHFCSLPYRSVRSSIQR
jgi:hypothetical protein